MLPHKVNAYKVSVGLFLLLLTRSFVMPTRRRFYIICTLHDFVYQFFSVKLKEFMNVYRTRGKPTLDNFMLEIFGVAWLPCCVSMNVDTDIINDHSFALPCFFYDNHGSGKHRLVINVTWLSRKLRCDYCSMLVRLYV